MISPYFWRFTWVIDGLLADFMGRAAHVPCLQGAPTCKAGVGLYEAGETLRFFINTCLAETSMGGHRLHPRTAKLRRADLPCVGQAGSLQGNTKGFL